MAVLGICETLSDFNLRRRLSNAAVRHSDLESAKPSSFFNGLDCFENLNKFDYL